MKKFLLLLLIAGLSFTACNREDDTDTMEEPEYRIEIMSPNADDKKVGDDIHVHVNFLGGEEAHGHSHDEEDEEHDNTIHHIKVRIYNEDTNEVIYEKPDAAHIHDTSGRYEHLDNITLSADNGVEENSNWILEAKVWGHDAGIGEVVETVKFHVHPE